MQTAIVIIIVAAAAFFLVRRFFNTVTAQEDGASSCGCGCSGCSPDQKQNCPDPQEQ
jgi:hypothetical protein